MRIWIRFSENTRDHASQLFNISTKKNKIQISKADM